jgi:acyl-coenzyme A synthetase/AMP-(fatty) acid ligase
LVSFCAVILRGQTNLLPPNKNVATQKQLNIEYSDSYIIHDGCNIAASIIDCDVSNLPLNNLEKSSLDIPQISYEHPACISFTSGSTGRSKPNLKNWRTLFRSTEINYKYMIPETDDTLYQLATMPAQHMWGLETSILMPLFQKICMSDAKPLFPQDIFDTLRVLPQPRLLVSTPVHLRALSSINDDTIRLFTVLCATSPLTSQLAQDIERQFSAPLREVYGCSEVGSMAVRRTVQDNDWLRFEGIHFEKHGEDTVASAEHLPESILLQDRIEPLGSQRFRLAGRATDLIKIAGKRGSLFEINQVLLCFEGLEDGIVINPDSEKAVTRLCAIVALKNGFDKAMLIRFLRESLDSAFVPRPIYVVDSLPRESNGKLLRAKIDSMLESLRR